MFKSRTTVSLVCFATLCGHAVDALGQTVVPPPPVQQPASPQPAAANTGAVAPQYAAPAPAPAAPVAPGAPVGAAAPPPPQAQYAVPQGYALVPIGGAYVPDAATAEREAERRASEQAMMDAYQEGDPVPDGYRVIQTSRRGLVISGALVGGIAYGFSVVGAVGNDFNDKSAALMIPVAGPWIMLALGGAKDKPCTTPTNTTGYSYYDYCSDDDRSGVRAALAFSGIAQATGAALLIVGLAYPKTQLVRKDIQLSMAPISFGKDSLGLGAIGRF